MTIERRNVWKVALLLILVLIAVWVPRILSLDQFATPDEAAWVGRSATFITPWRSEIMLIHSNIAILGWWLPGLVLLLTG